MSEKTKTILSSLVQSFLMLIIGGGTVVFLFLLGNFGIFPIYVTKVIPVVGSSGVLALLLTICWDLPVKWNKRIGVLFLCVFAVCGSYVGFHAAQSTSKENLATLDDRDTILYQYEPYIEGSKAILLKEPSLLQFDADTASAIHLDGATALYPIYASFVRNVWPESGVEIRRYEKDTTLACSGTSDAYVKVMKGEADMIFAAAPSEELRKVAEMCGIELHLTPIGREAFVFFVNSQNPVDGLSVEQIQKIYTGEIKNWKELGGSSQSIRAFQRDENSGSQTALEQLMNGLPLMEPEKEDRIGSMGGIIRDVANYRNYDNAIGFSFRFYSTEMVQNGDIKLLALNGVEPTKETIRDGSYPIASYFYAVTASPIGQPAPEAENEDLAALLDWILSPQGQQIIEETGYVSLH